MITWGLHLLDKREYKNPPTDCVIEALGLCLNSNSNSVFNKTNYL